MAIILPTLYVTRMLTAWLCQYCCNKSTLCILVAEVLFQCTVVIIWYEYIVYLKRREIVCHCPWSSARVTAIADRSMQMNEGLFMMNSRCGYVLQPECMRHPAYDPYDKHSLSRVSPPIEPVHISLVVSTLTRLIWVISVDQAVGGGFLAEFTPTLTIHKEADSDLCQSCTLKQKLTAITLTLSVLKKYLARFGVTQGWSMSPKIEF